MERGSVNCPTAGAVPIAPLGRGGWSAAAFIVPLGQYKLPHWGGLRERKLGDLCVKTNDKAEKAFACE